MTGKKLGDVIFATTAISIISFLIAVRFTGLNDFLACYIFEGDAKYSLLIRGADGYFNSLPMIKKVYVAKIAFEIKVGVLLLHTIVAAVAYRMLNKKNGGVP